MQIMILDQDRNPGYALWPAHGEPMATSDEADNALNGLDPWRSKCAAL